MFLNQRFGKLILRLTKALLYAICNLHSYNDYTVCICVADGEASSFHSAATSSNIQSQAMGLINQMGMGQLLSTLTGGAMGLGKFIIGYVLLKF